MTALELDPLFVKALRLLHSRAKDSTEQLRQLLIDCLHPNSTSSGSGFEKQEKSTVLHSHSSLIKKASPKHPVEQCGRKISIKDTEDVIVTHKRKEYSDKRLVDVPDWLQDPPPKRLKIDSPKPSRSPSPAKINKTDDVKKEVDEDLSFDDTDAAHIALEMGLACEVCRSFDVTTGNTLVECQDCHTLYHQDCHKPPISEQDINDPRVVWYCAKCTKNLKKIVSKTTKTSKTTVSLNPKETIVIPKPVKLEPALPQASIFKRSELKANNTGGTTTPPLGGSNKPIGLAALAASLSGGKAPQNVKSSQVPLWKGASSSSSSSSSSSKSTPATSPGPSGSKTAAVASTLAEAKPCAFSALMASTRATLPGSGTNSSGNGGNGSATLAKGLHSASTTTTAMKQSSSAVASSATSSTSSTSSSSGAKPSSSSSLMSADKRLQIMKKKAAAKRHEKRKLSSK